MIRDVGLIDEMVVLRVIAITADFALKPRFVAAITDRGFFYSHCGRNLFAGESEKRVGKGTRMSPTSVAVITLRGLSRIV